MVALVGEASAGRDGFPMGGLASGEGFIAGVSAGGEGFTAGVSARGEGSTAGVCVDSAVDGVDGWDVQPNIVPTTNRINVISITRIDPFIKLLLKGRLPYRISSLILDWKQANSRAI